MFSEGGCNTEQERRGKTRTYAFRSPYKTKPLHKLNVHSADLIHRILCERAVSRALAGKEIEPKDVIHVKIILKRVGAYGDPLYGEARKGFDALTKKLGVNKMKHLVDIILAGVENDVQTAYVEQPNQTGDERGKIIGVQDQNMLHNTRNSIMMLSNMRGWLGE